MAETVAVATATAAGARGRAVLPDLAAKKRLDGSEVVLDVKHLEVAVRLHEEALVELAEHIELRQGKQRDNA